MERKRITALLAMVVAMLTAVPTMAQDPLPKPLGITACDTLIEDSLLADTTMSATAEKEAAVDRNAWDYKLRQRLAPLEAEAKKSRYSTGICVYDLTGDSLLYAYNAQRRFRPASTQKLLTAITALDLFGKQGEYLTNVYMDGKISHDQVVEIRERVELESHYSESLGDSIITEIVLTDTTYSYKDVLHGNIYVSGGFDPLFSASDLQDLSKAVGRLNFEEMDGFLIGDISMKDSLVFGRGWSWDDMPSSFVPWLSPLLFNEGIRLRSKNGNYMSRPDRYFLDNLASGLRERGKEISDNQLRLSYQKAVPSDARLVFSRTHTIGDLLTRMMKKSNNQFAESMFYLIGYNKGQCGHPATADDCAAHIFSLMEKAGCTNMNETAIADGSGLSPYNYVSAENEVLLLRYAYQNKQIYEPLYKSLPIAGVDGTLSGRMRSGAAYKNVHAKTGTLNGVVTLAGYVRASNGNMLAFSILINGVSSNATGRYLQDRICQALAK